MFWFGLCTNWQSPATKCFMISLVIAQMNKPIEFLVIENFTLKSLHDYIVCWVPWISWVYIQLWIVTYIIKVSELGYYNDGVLLEGIGLVTFCIARTWDTFMCDRVESYTRTHIWQDTFMCDWVWLSLPCNITNPLRKEVQKVIIFMVNSLFRSKLTLS